MLFSLPTVQTRKKTHIFKEMFNKKNSKDMLFEIEPITILFFKSALKKQVMAYC